MTQATPRPFPPADDATQQDLRSTLQEDRAVDRAGLVAQQREVTAELGSFDARVARSSPER
jgi:hypothetical protein